MPNIVHIYKVKIWVLLEFGNYQRSFFFTGLTVIILRTSWLMLQVWKFSSLLKTLLGLAATYATRAASSPKNFWGFF